MTETPSPSIAAPAKNGNKLPRWALPAMGGVLVVLVLIMALRPAQNRAAGADEARLAQLAQRLETIEGLVARLPASGTTGQAAAAGASRAAWGAVESLPGHARAGKIRPRPSCTSRPCA